MKPRVKTEPIDKRPTRYTYPGHAGVRQTLRPTLGSVMISHPRQLRPRGTWQNCYISSPAGDSETDTQMSSAQVYVPGSATFPFGVAGGSQDTSNMVSAAEASSTSSSTSGLLSLDNNNSDTAMDQENLLDEASVKGIFGWSTVDGVSVPCLFRGGKKFVSVRIVEQKLLSRYPSDYPEELKQRPPLLSQFITTSEAKLLNEINVEHCNYEFGTHPFTTKDLVVALEDFEEFYDIVKKNFPGALFRRRGISALNVAPGVPQGSSSVSGGLTMPRSHPSGIESNFHPLRDDRGRMRIMPTLDQTDPFPQNHTTATFIASQIQGGWIQINNTVVPYVIRNNIKMVPLKVVQFGAGLLKDLQEETCVRSSPDECEYLTDICKTAGLTFTFSVKATAFVASQAIPMMSKTPVKMKDLPKDDPFGSAEYDPVSDDNSSANERQPMSDNVHTSMIEPQYHLPTSHPSPLHGIGRWRGPPNVTVRSMGPEGHSFWANSLASLQPEGYPVANSAMLPPPPPYPQPMVGNSMMHTMSQANSSAAHSISSIGAAKAQQTSPSPSASPIGAANPQQQTSPALQALMNYTTNLTPPNFSQNSPIATAGVAAPNGVLSHTQPNLAAVGVGFIPQRMSHDFEPVRPRSPSLTGGQRRSSTETSVYRCDVAMKRRGTVKMKPPQDQKRPRYQSSQDDSLKSTSCNKVSIQPADFHGRVISCLLGRNKRRLGLVEAISRVYFPKSALADFLHILQVVLQLPTYPLDVAEEAAFIEFYKLPTKRLKCRKVLDLEDLDQYMPQLQHMYANRFDSQPQDGASAVGSSTGEENPFLIQSTERNVGNKVGPAQKDSSVIATGKGTSHSFSGSSIKQGQPSVSVTMSKGSIPKKTKKLSDTINRLRQMAQQGEQMKTMASKERDASSSASDHEMEGPNCASVKNVAKTKEVSELSKGSEKSPVALTPLTIESADGRLETGEILNHEEVVAEPTDTPAVTSGSVETSVQVRHPDHSSDSLDMVTKDQEENVKPTAGVCPSNNYGPLLKPDLPAIGTNEEVRRPDSLADHKDQDGRSGSCIDHTPEPDDESPSTSGYEGNDVDPHFPGNLKIPDTDLDVHDKESKSNDLPASEESTGEFCQSGRSDNLQGQIVPEADSVLSGVFDGSLECEVSDVNFDQIYDFDQPTGSENLGLSTPASDKPLEVQDIVPCPETAKVLPALHNSMSAFDSCAIMSTESMESRVGISGLGETEIRCVVPSDNSETDNGEPEADCPYPAEVPSCGVSVELGLQINSHVRAGEPGSTTVPTCTHMESEKVAAASDKPENMQDHKEPADNTSISSVFALPVCLNASVTVSVLSGTEVPTSDPKLNSEMLSDSSVTDDMMEGSAEPTESSGHDVEAPAVAVELRDGDMIFADQPQDGCTITSSSPDHLMRDGNMIEGDQKTMSLQDDDDEVVFCGHTETGTPQAKSDCVGKETIIVKRVDNGESIVITLE